MAVNEVLISVLSILYDKKIPVCVIGELALNYYNVPRVVHVRYPLTPEITSLLIITRISNFVFQRPLYQ